LPRRRLDFWETSQDEATGKIRFRRQTQFIKTTEGQGGDAAASTALPMGRLVRMQLPVEERFVERFEAHDIELDDDSDSSREAKPCVATDDKLGTEWEGVAQAK
jgi:hypothetical protein